jgi:predicted Zn-dependent peptidase
MSVKFKVRTGTTHIFVHCAATKPSMDIGVREIRLWHKRDNGWLDIGYHFVIRRDGTIENGRPQDVVGAHAKNYNSNSVSVCLVGGINDAGKPESNYTEAQWASLDEVVSNMSYEYPNAVVLGHRDVDSGKACPCFDVKAWWAKLNA